MHRWLLAWTNSLRYLLLRFVCQIQWTLRLMTAWYAAAWGARLGTRQPGQDSLDERDRVCGVNCGFSVNSFVFFPSFLLHVHTFLFIIKNLTSGPVDRIIENRMKDNRRQEGRQKLMEDWSPQETRSQKMLFAVLQTFCSASGLVESLHRLDRATEGASGWTLHKLRWRIDDSFGRWTCRLCYSLTSDLWISLSLGYFIPFCLVNLLELL